MQNLNKKQFEEKSANDNTVIIDVLDTDSFAKEHIPGSISIPLKSANFVKNVQNEVPDRDTEVIVYCASTQCPASTDAAKKLEEAGYTNVYDFKGGIEEWKQAGGRLEKGAA